LRVLIIDHDRRVRRGLSDLLTTETDLEICATAGSPRTALAHISAQRPDVALLDVLLPDPAQGLSHLQKLHTLGLPVVVLTTAASLRDQAQQSGAAAFLDSGGLPAGAKRGSEAESRARGSNAEPLWQAPSARHLCGLTAPSITGFGGHPTRFSRSQGVARDIDDSYSLPRGFF
jgi:DNA-binding NtrC family response regulator